MVKAADTRKPHNFCVHRGVGLDCSALWRLLEARVDSVRVVVRRKRQLRTKVSKKTTQLVLIEHDHMVNEFAFA